MQNVSPIQDHKRISLSSSLSLPDFSSAYCFSILLSFLPWWHYRWIRHFVFYHGFCNSLNLLLRSASKKTVSIVFKDCLWLSRRFFSKFKDNSRTNCTFLEFQEFSRTKVIFKDFSRSMRTLYSHTHTHTNAHAGIKVATIIAFCTFL